MNVKWNPSAVAVEQPKTKFSIYPVPAKDFLNVEFEGSFSKVRAEIYTILGVNVLQQDLLSGHSQVNLTGLKAGIYLIKCMQGNNLIGSTRFIVDF